MVGKVIEEKTKVLSLLQLTIIVISMLVSAGIIWGTTIARIDRNEQRIQLLEERHDQIDRMEYNLRRLCERNGIGYETFGEKTKH